jgi:hypothetical protein
MKKKSLISEVRQFQKIAGILKEDFNGVQNNTFGVGDKVAFGYEGEPKEIGTIDDIATNYDEAVRKGGDLNQWDQLFNDQEAAEDYGYDSFEDWVREYVSKHKNSIWYEISSDESRYGEWFPAEYVESAEGYR